MSACAPPGLSPSAVRAAKLCFTYANGELLATEPLVAEQVQLNLPTHPLCREDCRGLCPRCGANLNDGPCGCAEPPGDPRWAALAGLRDKMPGRGTG